MDIKQQVEDRFAIHSQQIRDYIVSVAGTDISEEEFIQGYLAHTTQKAKPSSIKKDGKKEYRRAKEFGVL